MNIVIVWLLITSSDISTTRGNMITVGKFPTAVDCKFVQDNLPNKHTVISRCIQAKMVKDW